MSRIQEASTPVLHSGHQLLWDFKALNVSFMSEVNAYNEPRILRHLRCFNWLSDGPDDGLEQIFENDDIDALRQRLMDGKLTPWDLMSLYGYDRLPIILVRPDLA